MAILNTVTNILGAIQLTPGITAPGKMWHLLILNVFDFVAEYGWRIVLFTVLLKLVLSPLDFYQRYKMNKNQKITDRLKPTLEKLQKQCGDNKQLYSQKQMELNRKEGYSYMSACLPMIVTLVVFMTLWTSMNTIGRYMTFKEYVTLYDSYTYAYEQVEEETHNSVTAKDVAQDVVFKQYYDGIDDDFVKELRIKYSLGEGFELDLESITDKPVQTSFLWIKNVWAPDVPWGSRAILDWKTFESAVGDYAEPETNGISGEQVGFCFNESIYNDVMGKLLADETHSHVNGYLILPILVVLLSVASQLITSLQQKRAGQANMQGGMATSMKVMMFIMPLMMAFFALQYASVFTLYMVTNSACTLFFNFTFTAVIKFMDKRKASRNYGIASGSTRSYSENNDKSPIIHYVRGANPNAGARVATPRESKKAAKNKNQTPSVRKGGRPDPNELMNYDMSDKKKK